MKVLVINGRPGAITDRFTIELPRPRADELAAAADYQRYTAAVRAAIRE